METTAATVEQNSTVGDTLPELCSPRPDATMTAALQQPRSTLLFEGLPKPNVWLYPGGRHPSSMETGRCGGHARRGHWGTTPTCLLSRYPNWS